MWTSILGSSSPILGMKKMKPPPRTGILKKPHRDPPPSPQRKIIILEWHPGRKTARSFMKFLPAFLRKTQEIVILSHLPPFPLPTDSSSCKTVWDGLKICVFPKKQLSCIPLPGAIGVLPATFQLKNIHDVKIFSHKNTHTHKKIHHPHSNKNNYIESTICTLFYIYDTYDVYI